MFQLVIVLYICVGKTVNNNTLPSSTEHMYVEVDVAGEVKRSQDIQLIFNKAYGPVVKDIIQVEKSFL